MNKKLIAIIVGTLAVLAIVLISIFGAGIESGDDHKNVLGIEILTPGIDPTTYNDEDNTLITNLIMESGTTQYTIEWNVLPSDATDKSVTFASNNTAYATVSEIGVVAFLQEESVQITITCVDDTTKKAIVNFVFPAPTESYLNVEMDETSVNFDLPTDANLLHSYLNNQLVLLEGATYTFGLGEDLSLSMPEGTSATIDRNVITANQKEEFLLTVTKSAEGAEDITKDVSVKVVPYLDVFNVGSQYLNYLSTMTDFQKPAEQQTTEFLNKTVTPYLVGADNEFYFNILLRRPNDLALTQSEVELEYTVKDLENESVDLSTIATLNGNNIKFNNSAIGNTYTFTVLPKYNEIFNRLPLTYTIKITNGVNVWTSDQLFNAYKDLNILEINIHSTILVTPRANQLVTLTRNGVEETRLNNYSNIGLSGALRENCGTLYPRYIPSTYTGKNEIVLNGNFFTLNAMDVPYFNYDGRDGQSGSLPWANDIASVQEGLFQLQDDRDVANKDENNFASATYNNLKIKGNSAKGPIYTLDDQGDLTDEEQVKRLTEQGSGLPILMTRGGITNVNNVIASNSIFTFWSARSKARVELNYAKTYDIWGGAIYGYGTSEIELTNVNFSRLGGAAISYEDATYSDWLNPTYSPEYLAKIAPYTADYLDLVLTINENVVISNYLTGLEGWFVVNGFNAVVPSLKANINSILSLANKTMIKNNITSENSEDFNYVLQIVSSSGMDRPDSSFNDNIDIQYTIKQMIGRDEVTGDRIYRTTVRKNGFKASNPLTTVGGGNYVAALGDYSNLENLPTLLANDETKAWGYTLAVIGAVLQSQNTFASLPGYATIATQIGAAAQAIISNNPAMQTDPTLPLIIASSQSLRQGVLQMLEGQDPYKQSIESNMQVMVPAAFMANLILGSGANQLQLVEILPVYVEAVGRQLALFVEFFEIA